ncbi:twin arginine-targeting protein translocase TatC [Anoxybacillus sp. B7M1]|jgi:sec-independent protein translocase protein TatC|uniref:twin-arginine translocase subunit TatC n=1 Tax=unclassified Anoxybacillus TaxID=2639704 RepID=UPI0005CCAB9B|nr:MULTISPECIES: twin-arginine translocase subunit TatC [unclassified Anoxybacillus]ANB55940.1 twin arginine-targeting protein translocase TatC [Anoxybacillus sp. B2M1]ANB63508.1 twin arginine-targeting protein translocase TatC [Anoxybacillus sp. B7M1]
MSDKEMSVYEHLGELRKRLIIVLIFFAIALTASFFLVEPVIRYLQQADEARELTMNAFRLTDPIKIYMQFAFVIALIMTAPVLLYQIWAFVSPGLYEKERKVTLSYIPLSLFLFLSGISFAYFVLFPFVVRFMQDLATDLGINQVIGINEYFTFLLQLVLPFGALFQLPVLVMFLTRLGLITPFLLSKGRRYAYLLLLIVAAIITPPDVISQLIVMIPLSFLYEVSIWISRIAYRKVLLAEQARADLK